MLLHAPVGTTEVFLVGLADCGGVQEQGTPFHVTPRNRPARRLNKSTGNELHSGDTIGVGHACQSNKEDLKVDVKSLDMCTLQTWAITGRSKSSKQFGSTVHL